MCSPPVMERVSTNRASVLGHVSGHGTRMGLNERSYGPGRIPGDHMDRRVEENEHGKRVIYYDFDEEEPGAGAADEE